MEDSMFTALVIAATVTVSDVTPRATPQCEYRRYVTAGIWTALDDAERAGASVYVRNNLENTLRDTVRREREACRV